MIRVLEQKINADDFNYLTEKVGWGTRDKIIVEEALNNTVYSICAYDDNQLIGYGRLIGDRTIFLYVQDVMIIPEYQGRKIGTEIMNKIISKILVFKNISPSLTAPMRNSPFLSVGGRWIA